MERSFEAVLVEQCATTLAGVKPASLFRYQALTSGSPGRPRPAGPKKLAPYGITIRVLKYCPQTGACLIYLYRADGFGRILSEPSTRLSGGAGVWGGSELSGAAETASRRRVPGAGIPHEIGVFLGYPLEDVVGFIRNRGRNYTCCGYWKAYGDPEAAQKRFDQYRRCTAACCEQFRKARPSRS